MISSVIQDSLDSPPLQVLVEYRSKLRAPRLVVSGTSEIGVELRGIPRLEGTTHVPVLVGTIAAIGSLQFSVIETGIVKHEPTGLTPHQIDAEWFSIPDSFRQKWRDQGPLELPDWAIANNTGRYFGHLFSDFRILASWHIQAFHLLTQSE